VHGSPRDPIEEYVDSPFVAETILELMDVGVCFLGHTHRAEVYFKGPYAISEVQEISFFESGSLKLKEDCKYIINPGGVGQPRDGNPKASFAIMDTKEREVEIKRVDYDIEEAARKIREAGLPRILYERLREGY
jgi:diadenosine tetraphosphatase ApaH/serine/threonine PP2A family protein phosphatase